MLSSGTKEAKILRLKDGFRQMKIGQEQDFKIVPKGSAFEKTDNKLRVD